jgi:hypothetical protein
MVMLSEVRLQRSPPSTGTVLDPEQELRVGVFPGGGDERARGFGGGALGGKLRRALFGKAQSLVEPEELCVGGAREDECRGKET